MWGLCYFFACFSVYKYELFWACEAIAQLHRAHKRWNSDPSAVNGYFAVPFVVAKAALVIWAVDTELSQAASISSQNHFDARFTVLSVCMSGDYSLMQVMPCHHLPALTFQNLKIENWTFGQSSVFLTTCRSSCFQLYSCKMELDWLQQVELICSFGFLIEGLSALESELRDLFWERLPAPRMACHGCAFAAQYCYWAATRIQNICSKFCWR